MTLFLCVFFFFIAHLSGKHNTLFTPGSGAAFDGAAPTLAQSKSIQTLEYVTVGFGHRGPCDLCRASCPVGDVNATGQASQTQPNKETKPRRQKSSVCHAYQVA